MLFHHADVLQDKSRLAPSDGSCVIPASGICRELLKSTHCPVC